MAFNSIYTFFPFKSSEYFKERKNKEYGGIDNYLQRIESDVDCLLMEKRIKKNLFENKGKEGKLIILEGKAGTGKTTIIQKLIQNYRNSGKYFHYQNIEFENFIHRNIQTIQRFLLEALQLAQLNQPSILILENIDSIITTDQQGEFTLIADQLAEYLVDLVSSIQANSNSHQIAFIITCKNINQLHKSLLTSFLLYDQIQLLPPSTTQRIDVNFSHIFFPFLLKKFLF